MKEVKIRQVGNGYIVEYWSKPTSLVAKKDEIELDCTEVYSLFDDLTKELREYFGVDN